MAFQLTIQTKDSRALAWLASIASIMECYDSYQNGDDYDVSYYEPDLLIRAADHFIDALDDAIRNDPQDIDWFTVSEELDHSLQNLAKSMAALGSVIEQGLDRIRLLRDQYKENV